MATLLNTRPATAFNTAEQTLAESVNIVRTALAHRVARLKGRDTAGTSTRIHNLMRSYLGNVEYKETPYGMNSLAYAQHVVAALFTKTKTLCLEKNPHVALPDLTRLVNFLTTERAL